MPVIAVSSVTDKLLLGTTPCHSTLELLMLSLTTFIQLLDELAPTLGPFHVLLIFESPLSTILDNHI